MSRSIEQTSRFKLSKQHTANEWMGRIFGKEKVPSLDIKLDQDERKQSQLPNPYLSTHSKGFQFQKKMPKEFTDHQDQLEYTRRMNEQFFGMQDKRKNETSRNQSLNERDSKQKMMTENNNSPSPSITKERIQMLSRLTTESDFYKPNEQQNSEAINPKRSRRLRIHKSQEQFSSPNMKMQSSSTKNQNDQQKEFNFKSTSNSEQAKKNLQWTDLLGRKSISKFLRASQEPKKEEQENEQQADSSKLKTLPTSRKPSESGWEDNNKGGWEDNNKGTNDSEEYDNFQDIENVQSPSNLQFPSNLQSPKYQQSVNSTMRNFHNRDSSLTNSISGVCFESEQIDPFILDCILKGDWKTLVPPEFDDSQINMKTIFETNIDQFLHLIGQCACTRCNCGRCKCDGSSNKIRSSFKSSVYAKDFINRDASTFYNSGPVITEEIRQELKLGQKIVDMTSQHQRDYIEYKNYQKAKPFRSETFRNNSPVNYMTTYKQYSKSQFVSYGTESQRVDPIYQYTTLKQMPFIGQSSYNADYVAKPLLNNFDAEKGKKGTSPIGNFTPFLGQTSHRSQFKPFDENDNIYKDYKENPSLGTQQTPSFRGQYLSQYSKDQLLRQLPKECSVKRLKKMWEKQYKTNHDQFLSSKGFKAATETK